MNACVILLSCFLASYHPSYVALLDTDLKKPIGRTDNFTLEHYTSKKFPVYVDDVGEVSITAQKLSKLLEHKASFSFDSVKVGHSIFILNTQMVSNHAVITVRLVTLVKESRNWFSLELVKQEEDKRKMQRRLLDLSSYLDGN